MVQLFTKPNCQPCKATKRVLNSKGVPYEEIDISTNEAAREKIKGLGFMQAPVIITDDDSWSGFNPAKLGALASVSA